jgi:hypothetical protein
MSPGLQINKNKVMYSTFSYILSAITGIIGLLNWMILRETLVSALTNSSISVWAIPAVHNFGFLLFGIGWLIFVLFSQSFYLKGARKKRLWINFSFLTGIQVFLLLICHVINLLLGISQLDFYGLLLIMIESIVGIALILFWNKSKKNQHKIKISEEGE